MELYIIITKPKNSFYARIIKVESTCTGFLWDTRVVYREPGDPYNYYSTHFKTEGSPNEIYKTFHTMDSLKANYPELLI